MKNSSSKRIPELDSLRGIAAISVMYFHYSSYFRPKLDYDFSSQLDFKYGHHGVELFFIISGFVIFMSLERIKSVNDFLYKRFLRLYPTYWICLGITLTFSLNASYFEFTVKEKVLNFLMFQGFFGIRNIDGSYWSLVPELFFYVLMIILWKFKLLQKQLLVGIIWLFAMGLSLLRPSLIDIILNLKFGMYFLIGMMFYQLRKNKNLRYPHIIIFLSLIATIFVRTEYESFVFTFFFVIIFYLLIYEKLNFLNNNVAIFLGKISYPLYLLHQTIGFILISYLIKLGVNDYYAILFTVIFIIALSWTVYEYLEKPILKRFK